MWRELEKRSLRRQRMQISSNLDGSLIKPDKGFGGGRGEKWLNRLAVYEWMWLWSKSQVIDEDELEIENEVEEVHDEAKEDGDEDERWS